MNNNKTEIYSTKNIFLRIRDKTYSFYAGVNYNLYSGDNMEILSIINRGNLKINQTDDVYINILGTEKNIVYTKDKLGSNVYHICLNHHVTCQLLAIASSLDKKPSKYDNLKDSYIVVNTVTNKIHLMNEFFFSSEDFFDSVSDFIKESIKVSSLNSRNIDRIAVLKRHKNNKLKITVYGRSLLHGEITMASYETYIGRKIAEKVFTQDKKEQYKPIEIVKKELNKFKFLKGGNQDDN